MFIAGPTNSGKTYNALQAFKAAEKGVYCGPLRLLAMEVYDSTNADGVLCNLVTGTANTVHAVIGATRTYQFILHSVYVFPPCRTSVMINMMCARL